jgi:fatty-acyl-CoA synthase
MAAATPTPNLRSSPYANGLDKNPANYVALSPLSFIERAAWVYPEHTAIVYGHLRQTWRVTYGRCRRLSSALSRLGIGAGDTVAACCPMCRPCSKPISACR